VVLYRGDGVLGDLVLGSATIRATHQNTVGAAT
jgi:hypothetical protein